MIEFEIPDMTCGHCASMVGMVLHMVDPDCKVQIKLSQRKVTVESTEDRAFLAEVLADAGYPPAGTVHSPEIARGI